MHGFLTRVQPQMTFRRELFEDFNENVYGIVYFADKSSLKPSGMGTIRLKLPVFPDFLLHNVLYLPEIKRIFLSLVHIRKQGLFVHMIDVKFKYERIMITCFL
jgi:hypothetical protein